ncbi:sensor histidine kinase, partial [Myxococcota bacterium]|nr:sensor histidine kinase [Myxococcota bacterium]
EISNYLRPPGLDDLGLREAISAQVSDFEKNTGLSVELSVYFQEDSIPVDIRLHIYRILQEALTNISKHADARNVKIALSHSSDGVNLFVEDDGKGFSVDEVDFRNHHGILGMRERSRYLEGTLNFTTPPGSGTRVELNIPMNFSANSDESGESDDG